jgi:MerR family redox-sensitive transcriptional activator SoxR
MALAKTTEKAKTTERAKAMAKDQRELRIGEVAQRSGLAASAIRFYEAERLLPKPERRSGQRVYPEAVLDQLAMIDLAKRAGFTVAEIKQLVAGFERRTPPGVRWRALTGAKRAELDLRIAEAQRMKLVLEQLARCQCPTQRDCARAMRAAELD